MKEKLAMPCTGQQWEQDINNGGEPENFNSWIEKQALTEVKSESAEEVLILQKGLNEYINLRHTQEECTGFVDGYKKAMHDFANNSEAKWISIEDGLPEVHIPVIVSCEHGVTMATYTSFPNGNSLWWAVTSIGTYEDSTNADNVTHWMSLPTPPNQ